MALLMIYSGTFRRNDPATCKLSKEVVETEKGASRVRWLREDGLGFLIAAALTTAPLLVVTCFFEFLSKDGPIGLAAYIVPAAIGLTAAALIGIGGRLVGRGNSGPVGPEFYFGFGALASIVLFVSFCAWWGAWSLRFAERFRN
jgi:hypothetical protein